MSATTTPPPAEAVIGASGLVAVHYRGFQLLSEYEGLETKTVYVFGMERMTGYIDSRDLQSILAVVEDGQKVFELWQS